ncbi:hypothetical protein AcW1_001348 [Taiwanofungus camphoratus]|nr:hypothetical protein AcW1_001348 [Antrodia cinnamomea]
MLKFTLAALFLGLYLGIYVPAVVGNTEIVNFDAVEGHDVILSPTIQWPVLRYGEAERLLQLQPARLGTSLEDVCGHSRNILAPSSCAHELWFILDLDSPEWIQYSKFTLRISWPASSPADFSIQIYSPESLVKFIDHSNSDLSNKIVLPSRTRRQFARIRVVDTGVRTPAVVASALYPQANAVEPVPFNLLLEPLYFGVLPASVAPIVLFLIPVILFAGLVLAPFVNRHLRAIAQEARSEITAASVLPQKEE